jgi:hypothetical protein
MESTMTTIVGDWRRKILVADTQLSDDDSNTKTFGNDKVFVVPQGLLAGAGDFISIQQVVQYFKEGKKGKAPVIKDADDADFLLLTEEGLFVAGKDLRFQSLPKYDAIGSGTLAALAVLSLGHSAEEAVWAATQSDLYSGEPVKVYSLHNKPYTWRKNEASVSESEGKKVTAVGEGSDTPTIPYAQH